MPGDYKKFTIEMKRETAAFRLWKRGADSAACIAETYKNKRSIYFAATNLLPSQVLMRESNKEYHLLLIGVDEGELVHKDFGAFYVNHQGEVSFFKKFAGPPMECYTHCLFVALDKETGGTETVYRGVMPFFQPSAAGEVTESETEEAAPEACAGSFEDAWQEIFERFFDGARTDFFAEDIDETKAAWCRVSQSSPLPASLSDCRSLITAYGHYIIGRNEETRFVGVPGRFLKKEQPCREQGCFTLWQPLRGGEKYFSALSEMPEKLQEEIFGYWICAVDEESGELIAL